MTLSPKLQAILNGTKVHDPMSQFKSRRAPKIVKPLQSTTTELKVHLSICKYLKLQYPDVMFLSDFGAGIKMSIGMASRQNLQKSNHAFPDLMIFEPRGGYYGLFIEIKKDAKALYKQNGEHLKSDHIEDQHYTILELTKRGYMAYFGCGFDECRLLIDKYLSL